MADLKIRDRIKEFRRVAASELVPNPRNWRRHPKEQAAALRGLLEEIGYADALLARELEDGRLMLIDGHLRAEASKKDTVPVLVLDVSQEDADKILLTLDPLAAMAQADMDAVRKLLETTQFQSAAIGPLLEKLAGQEGWQAIAGDGAPGASNVSLADRFLVPPFSVLDARQGYWQDRKRAWLALGIESEIGRGANMLGFSEGVNASFSGEAKSYSAFKEQQARVNLNLQQSHSPEISTIDFYAQKRKLEAERGEKLTTPQAREILDAQGKLRDERAGNKKAKSKKAGAFNPAGDKWRGKEPESAEHRQAFHGVAGDPVAAVIDHAGGTSIFDPVLCEIAYRWFCPPGGRVLDPFAGGSVRGVIASKCGRDYFGLELRREQIGANIVQGKRICQEHQPAWIEGDARDAGKLLKGTYDFVFTCPPYGDLEVYSDDPRDLSTMKWPEFVKAYRQIIKAACEMLKPDRFAMCVVGDIRDEHGNYRRLPNETALAFGACGLELYNDAILVTAVGSLPVRVGRAFESGRKLGKTHQNVLVFIKGDAKKATAAIGKVEFGDNESVQAGS